MTGRLRSALGMLAVRELSLRWGTCALCGPTVFVRLCDNESGVRCVRCGASHVHQSIGWAIRDKVPDLATCDVCEFSARGPLVRFLRRHARTLAESEYFPDIPSGALRQNVRCEDVQALSYADLSFDLVTHTEVLEHVADDRAALREMWRILRPGGMLIFTVPVHTARETVERAHLSGDHIEHVAPPVYHGDPLRQGAGVLAFRDYGDDLRQRVAAAGFADVYGYTTRRTPWWPSRQVLLAKKHE